MKTTSLSSTSLPVYHTLSNSCQNKTKRYNNKRLSPYLSTKNSQFEATPHLLNPDNFIPSC